MANDKFCTDFIKKKFDQCRTMFMHSLSIFSIHKIDTKLENTYEEVQFIHVLMDASGKYPGIFVIFFFLFSFIPFKELVYSISTISTRECRISDH